MIRRDSRAHRILKWVGLVVCVVIAVTWAVSLFWVFGRNNATIVGTAPNGRALIDLDGFGFYRGLFFVFLKGDYGWGTLQTGWIAVRFPLKVSWWFAHVDKGYSLPLWIPFVIVAIPTLILWRWTRFEPGHCQTCGYNLTGNTSGICPECGTKITSEVKPWNRRFWLSLCHGLAVLVGTWMITMSLGSIASLYLWPDYPHPLPLWMSVTAYAIPVVCAGVVMFVSFKRGVDAGTISGGK